MVKCHALQAVIELVEILRRDRGQLSVLADGGGVVCSGTLTIGGDTRVLQHAFLR